MSFSRQFSGQFPGHSFSPSVVAGSLSREELGASQDQMTIPFVSFRFIDVSCLRGR